jgi:hypothetical protein
MAALSSSSSSSSAPDYQEMYGKICPSGSIVSYDMLGDSNEEAMNELATDWNLRGENKIILQSIWANHPKRQQGKKNSNSKYKTKCFLPSYFIYIDSCFCLSTCLIDPLF